MIPLMSKELQQKLDEILKKVDGLERYVEDQQKTIDAQQKNIDRQRKKIHQLESALAAAKKNSSNSSKPPSSDIIKPKKDNSNGSPNGATKKKPGGQPAHKGNFREEFLLENIDAVFEYALTNCPHCGCKLQNSDRAPSIVQQIKIVQKPIVIEEHRGIPYWCPACECFHYAPFPKEIEHGGLFDAKLTGIVAYMKGVCHASYSTIRKYLHDIIGIKVSRGYLKKVLEKVSDALLIPYDELRSALPLQSGLNIDESSLPENGRNLWLWAFEAELFSLYKIDPSRGSKVLIEMLGREFKGVIGCDYFSAYRKFMKKFNVSVQFCLAHLIRDIKYLVGLKDKATQRYGKRLGALFGETKKNLGHRTDVYEKRINSKTVCNHRAANRPLLRPWNATFAVTRKRGPQRPRVVLPHRRFVRIYTARVRVGLNKPLNAISARNRK